MLRLAEDGCRTVDFRVRLDEVGGVELIPTVVALVSARTLEPADGTGALDVPVREGVPGEGGERAEGLALDDIALVVKRSEDVLRDSIVIPRCRPREQVVRESGRVEV